MAYGNQPGLWVLLGGLIHDGANAEFIERPGHQAEMIQERCGKSGTSVSSRSIHRTKLDRHPGDVGLVPQGGGADDMAGQAGNDAGSFHGEVQDIANVRRLA